MYTISMIYGRIEAYGTATDKSYIIRHATEVPGAHDPRLAGLIQHFRTSTVPK